MRMRITSILTFSAALAFAAAAVADEAAKPGTPGTKDEAVLPARPGKNSEEFYRLHTELKTVLTDLANLQLKYRTADEDQRAEIQQQWKDAVAKGEKLEPKFIAAAEAAYAEAPNADPGVAELLARYLLQALQADDDESAARIGKLLMDNQCPLKELACWAGIAAFNVSDFDTAEQFLRKAEKDGYLASPSKEDKLAPLGPVYLQILPQCQKAWAIEQALREKEAKDDDLPRVLLKTSKGDIELELFENEAPNTVKNFISLVQKGFYDGLAFHRVLAGFMAQGGDPKGTGIGGPDYTIPCECYQANHRNHFRGSLSMAHTEQRDTGGSQFFITFVPTPHLDGKHTVFGRVISGMDVLAKLQRRDPGDKEAPRPDKIIAATVDAQARPSLRAEEDAAVTGRRQLARAGCRPQRLVLLFHDLLFSRLGQVGGLGLVGLGEILNFFLGLIALVLGEVLVLFGLIGRFVAVAADVADGHFGLFGQFLHPADHLAADFGRKRRHVQADHAAVVLRIEPEIAAWIAFSMSLIVPGS